MDLNMDLRSVVFKQNCIDCKEKMIICGIFLNTLHIFVWIQHGC